MQRHIRNSKRSIGNWMMNILGHFILQTFPIKSQLSLVHKKTSIFIDFSKTLKYQNQKLQKNYQYILLFKKKKPKTLLRRTIFYFKIILVEYIYMTKFFD